MGNIAISLVVSVEMGGPPLDYMLSHLAAQELPHHTCFEVLVIDCGEQAQPSGSWPFVVRWLHQPKESFGYVQRAMARNLGLAEAKGDVLVFLEEGLLAAPSYLAQHWAYHQTGQPLCVVGGQFPLNEMFEPGHWGDYAEKTEALMAEERAARQLAEAAPWTLVDGANFSVRRVELIRVGGYDSEYALYEKADIDLGYRLWKAGLRIVFSPAASAYRPPLITYPKTRWRGQGVDYLHYKHPELKPWAQVRQALLWLRDQNLHTTEKMLLSKACLERMSKTLARAGTGVPSEPQLSFALLVHEGEDNLSQALAQLAERVQALAPFEVLVFDASPNDAHAQVERITQIARLPFPVRYSPVNRIDMRDGEAADLRTGSPLSRLLLKDQHLSVDAQRQARERLHRLTRAPSAVLLAPAEIRHLPSHRAAIIPSLNGSRRRSTWRSAAMSPLVSTEEKWSIGSIAEGYSYPPRTVSFKLTNLCNLRCEMCGQWGPIGNALQKDKAALLEQMGLNELQAVIDQVMLFRPGMIYIWGGEPFLHPDFLEFVAYICRHGLYCLINTNGTRLLETARELVAIGPQYLRVSLDGPAEVHDRIRGRAGTFAKVIEGIKAIDCYKREQERLFPIVEVDCTISKSNYDSLEALLSALEGIGVHSVAYSHLVYVPPEVGERHARLFHQLFNCEAESWRGFVQDTSAIDTDRLSQTVARLQVRKDGMSVTFDPPMRNPADVALHYRDAARLYRNRYCCAPWLWAEIQANGDMAFCDDFPDYVLGNVRCASFLSVWNGERARRFRQELLRHKRFPICVHCGFLHHDPTF